METCSWCGKQFDLTEAEDYFFENTFSYSYSSFRIPLCGECAVEAIEDEADGVYFETCVQCGKTFDIADAINVFNSDPHFEMAVNITDYWRNGPICGECALDEVYEQNRQQQEFYEQYY